jgi:hypothetical protein
MSLLKNEEQESKTSLLRGVGTSEGGGYKERVKEGKYGENIM